MSKERFSELVEEALSDVPDDFARYLEEVTIEIKDQARPSERKRLGLCAHDRLLGLYHGRPRTERSVMDSSTFPDVIYLFQNDLQSVSDDEDELIEQVRKTVLHEIGHHFGLDEDDLTALGYG